MLIISVLFSAAFIYADNKTVKEFKDINEVKWASDYIREVAKNGIVKGYTDGNFKPRKKVTKSESVLMIYRMIDKLGLVGDVDFDALMKKHIELIDKNNIPNWKGLRPAIAYLLEKKIIPPTDLKGFVRNGMQVYINREQMASYLGAVLKTYTDVKVSGVVDLKYKDGAKINPNYAACVGLLYEKKVFTGDKNNNFNPKNSITRAETAKVIIQTMKVLRKEADVHEKPDVIEEKEIDAVVLTKVRNKLRLETRTKKLNVDVDPELLITSNGGLATLDDIKVDEDLTLVYKQNTLVRIDIKPSDMKTITGIVTDKIDNSSYQIIYYKNKEGTVVEFPLEKFYILRREGSYAELENVLISDKMQINIKNGSIYSIDFFKRDETISAKVKEVILGDEKRLKLSIDGEERTVVVPNDIEIYRNGAMVVFSSLRVDDELKIDTVYGKISKITAKSIIKTVEASLREIVIGEDKKITVWLNNDSDNEKIFTIARNVDVYTDNRKGKLVDLEIGSLIDVMLDGKEIVRIDTYKRLVRAFDGKIEEIDFKSKTLSIYDRNTSTYYTVEATSDTKVLNSDGKTLYFEDLLQGDQIYIKGYKKGTDFIAKSIIQL